MQVNRSRLLEDAMELDEARGHHCQIGHHVGVAQEGAEGTHRIGNAAATFDDFFVGTLGVHVPFPCIFEGHDLRSGTGAVALGEEDVVVLAAVEWRIEIDEVYGFVLDVLAQDGEVVAVIETVVFHCGGF